MRRVLAALVPSRYPHPCPEDPTATMRGVAYRHHGGIDVLEVRDDLAVPGHTDRHLIVDVRAAGINPVDHKVRHHEVSEWFLPLPKIGGTDLAGVVQWAPEGAPFAVGDRVFGMMPMLGTRWGAWAEQVPVEPRFLAATPGNVSDAEAAALPLVGLTVLQGLAPAIRGMGDPRGRLALVQAASGGTGSMAVQVLANVHGMRVIGTCSPANADLVRDLGAAEVLDYHTTRFEDVVRGAALVFDPLGYRYAARTLHSDVLEQGGHYVHLASSPWEQGRAMWGAVPEAAPGPMIRGFGRQLWTRLATPLGLTRAYVHHVFVHPSGAGMRELAAHVRDGRVRPVLDRTWPLSEVREAVRHVAGGHTRGKVVLSVSAAS